MSTSGTSIVHAPKGEMVSVESPVEEGGAIMATLVRAASDPNCDVAKTKELLAIMRTIRSDQRADLARDALSCGQLRSAATPRGPGQTRASSQGDHVLVAVPPKACAVFDQTPKR